MPIFTKDNFWKKNWRRRIKMENQKTNIEQMYRGLVVTWFALFVSQFLFFVVLYFVKPELFSFDFSQPLLPGKFAIIVGSFRARGNQQSCRFISFEEKILRSSGCRTECSLCSNSNDCRLCNVRIGFAVRFNARLCRQLSILFPLVYSRHRRNDFSLSAPR